MPPRLRRAQAAVVRGVKRVGRPVRRRLPGWLVTRSGPIAPGERERRLQLTAESVEWLELHAATRAGGGRRIHVLDLTVRRWRQPQPGWSGRLGPLPGLVSWAVTLPPSGNGTARVRLRVDRAVSVQEALLAAVPALRPRHRLPYPADPDLTVAGTGIGWLAGTGARTGPTPLPPNPVIRGYDTVLATGDPAAAVTAATDAGQLVRSTDGGLVVRDRAAPWPMLNLALAYPYERGRKSGPRLGAGVLELGEGGWRVRLGPGTVSHGQWKGEPFPPGSRSALRKVGVLRLPAVPAPAPDPLPGLLVHLAATGLVLDLPELPAGLADRLGPALRAVLATPLPAADADPIEWEIRSARQRTAAIREHAPAFALRAGNDAFPGLRPPPPVSALVVTHRPEFVDSVLTGLERQSYPELEVVLGLHGTAPPAGLRERLRDSRLPVELVTAEPGGPGGPGPSLGEVLGAVTGRARGSLLTKVDDDDWYGPEHVWDLVVARAYSGATMVGKAAEFVHVHQLAATVRRETLLPEQYGDPVAGGTMLIGRGELEELGGWRPVPRSVDRGLLDRVLRSGGAIYRTHPLGYLYERRASGHTWDVDLEFFLRGVKTRWPGRLRHPEFGTAAAPAGGDPRAGDAADPVPVTDPAP